MRTIPLLITGLIFFTGCTNDQYAMERTYWHLTNNVKRLLHTQENVPSLEWKRTAMALQKFIERYPDKAQALASQFMLAKLLLEQKDYTGARRLAQAVIQAHPESDRIRSEALFIFGQTYEKEGKWHDAVTYYRQISIQYPDTFRALLMPVYIAKYYQKTREDDKMREAFRDGAAFYTGQAEKFKGRDPGFNCLLLAAQCYQSLGDWEKTAKTLERIGEEYAEKQRVAPLMMKASEIYTNQLKDENKAIELREKINHLNEKK